MTRRNLNLLLAILLGSLVCYQRVGWVERSPHRGTIRALAESLEQIDRHYLEPVDRQGLLRGAMDGLIGQLDEYSAFFDPTTLAEFTESLDQEFGGIGIQVGLDRQSNQLVVMSPLVGSPAYAAGVQAGDAIIAIEQESTEGFKLDDAVRRLRGRPGDAVSLTIRRGGQPEPLVFRLTRAIIQTETVLGDLRHQDGTWDFMLEGTDRLAYVRVVSFSQRTAEELATALGTLEKEHPRGLILDLRNNPGGLLNTAVDVCNMFLSQGRIVTIRGRDGKTLKDYNADGSAQYTGWPMVVLINHYSASASEIVSACLADHRRAMLVGSRTWGKGSVQNVIELVGGSQGALKLTTASYWRPSGQNIHRGSTDQETDQWGVEPSAGLAVEVDDDGLRKLMEARQKRDVVLPRRRGDAAPTSDASRGDSSAELPSRSDPQLRRAVEYLESLVNQPAAA